MVALNRLCLCCRSMSSGGSWGVCWAAPSSEPGQEVDSPSVSQGLILLKYVDGDCVQTRFQEVNHHPLDFAVSHVVRTQLCPPRRGSWSQKD